MKYIAVLAFVVSLIFCSCNRNKPKTPDIQVVGDLDSSVIAKDTTLQRSFEESYEYAKTLNMAPKLAYDIRAFGGSASIGEYAIIRRGADNKPDTVALGKREGIIMDALTGDLNKNGEEEIYIITQSAGSGSYGNVIAWEINREGKARVIQFVDPANAAGEGYMGKDSIFIANNLLMRRFPVYKENDPNCCPTGGWMQESYQLKGNKLETVKKEKI